MICLLFRWLIVSSVLVPGMVNSAYLNVESASVQIEGLRSSYGPKSPVKALVRSSSAQRIEVNVAVEKLVENEWMEVFASITDPKHPYGKTVKLTPLESGASLAVSFKPLEKHSGVSPLGHSSLPLSLRLRVDVYGPHGGKIVDTVWSSVFRVSAEPAAPKSP